MRVMKLPCARRRSGRSLSFTDYLPRASAPPGVGVGPGSGRRPNPEGRSVRAFPCFRNPARSPPCPTPTPSPPTTRCARANSPTPSRFWWRRVSRPSSGDRPDAPSPRSPNRSPPTRGANTSTSAPCCSTRWTCAASPGATTVTAPAGRRPPSCRRPTPTGPGSSTWRNCPRPCPWSRPRCISSCSTGAAASTNSPTARR